MFQGKRRSLILRRKILKNGILKNEVPMNASEAEEMDNLVGYSLAKEAARIPSRTRKAPMKTIGQASSSLNKRTKI